MRSANRRMATTPPAMSPDRDGRQAARVVALTAVILFAVIFVLQAASF
jgi:hypothetical protein